MIRFALILLFSLAVSSQAAAKSNDNPSNTVQNTNIEHSSHLFYPTHVLDKFEKVPKFKKRKYYIYRVCNKPKTMLDSHSTLL